MIPHSLLDEIDRTLAFLGLILSLVSTIWIALTIGRLLYITLGILSCLVCAAYLIFRNSLSSLSLSALAPTSNKTYYVLEFIFFALLSSAILCLSIRSDPYVRPLSFFIILSLMTSILAVEILLLPSRRWLNYFSLFKMVLISLILEFSQLLIYPSVVGEDPWFHQMFTLKILTIGHIPGGYAYSQLPLMHLLIGSTSVITGLDYKLAAMVSVSLLQTICSVLLVFLLGRLLFGTKVGLLSGLLISVANWPITMGFWAIPNTMGATLVLAVVYLLFRERDEKYYIIVSIAILLMGTLIMTHTLSSAFLAILLFEFWAAFKAYDWIYRRWKTPDMHRLELYIVEFFGVGMFSWWIYVSGQWDTLTDLARQGLRLNYSLLPKEVLRYAYNVPFSEQLFNDLGMFLFFAGSILGLFFMMSKKPGKSRSFVFAIGAAATLLLSLFALVTGSAGIILERWFYFSQILLALPLAITFLLFCAIMRSRVCKAILLLALTFSLTFLMIMNPIVNMDNPTFSPNTQIRFALTTSELGAMERVSKMWSREIGTDSYYSNLQFSSYSVRDVDAQIYDGNFTEDQGLFILIREEIVSHPIKLLGNLYRLDYDPRDTLDSQKWSRVYDCGSVSGFVYSNNPYSFAALP